MRRTDEFRLVRSFLNGDGHDVSQNGDRSCPDRRRAGGAPVGFGEKIAADGKGPVNFTLLADPGHRIIDRYGLQDSQYVKLKQEGVPYPTAYVIDKSGRVAWTRLDRNFRERPPTAEIRAALDALR